MPTSRPLPTWVGARARARVRVRVRVRARRLTCMYSMYGMVPPRSMWLKPA